MDGTKIGAMNGYARRLADDTHAQDETFREYVLEEFPPAKPVESGASAKAKERLRLGRIRLKEGMHRRQARLSTKAARKQQAARVIESFMHDESDDDDLEARSFLGGTD